MALIHQPRDIPLLTDQDDTPTAVQTPLRKPGHGEEHQVRWLNRCCGGCCHDWKTVDPFMLIFCLLSLLSSLVLAVILAVNKQGCDGNCMLTAHYTPWAGIDYDRKSLWVCDALLFFTLFPATIVFIFLMVDWVAQQNNNARWLQIKIGLVTAIIVGYCIFNPFLFVGYAIWCERMTTDLNDNFEKPANHPAYPTSCVGTAGYLDTRLHRSESLTKVHLLTTVAMGVGISCVVFYTLLVGSLAYKLYDVFMAKKIKEYNTVLNAPAEEERRRKLRELPPIMGKHQRLVMEREAKAKAEREERERSENGPEQVENGSVHAGDVDIGGACGSSSDL